MIDNSTKYHISTDTPLEGMQCYAQPSIQLFNCDNLKLMAKMEDNSVDVILTDPPYLYLKNQKLEREFDEQLFFSECKRILTEKGFIVMFGRGVSFYRWNTILDDLGFVFKEEIIWNKRYISSPMTALGRTHETVSLWCKTEQRINKVKIPYVEAKRYDPKGIVQDIKRIKSILSNSKSLDAVEHYFNNNELDYNSDSYRRGVVAPKIMKSADRAAATVKGLKEGHVEKSIITVLRDHYSTIHPTQKPVRLLERLLALVIPEDKNKEDIIVFDPFGGSFSTMEAVYNMQMQGISCEIDEKYFLKGKERIENLPPRQTAFFD
jgi:site-specific DNA-methyltransferase (adenine-specific)